MSGQRIADRVGALTHHVNFSDNDRTVAGMVDCDPVGKNPQGREIHFSIASCASWGRQRHGISRPASLQLATEPGVV